MRGKIFITCLVLVLSSALYTMLLYKSEKTADPLIVERIQAARLDGSLLASAFPPSSALWTRDNLSGLDQSIEAFYALMVLYKNMDNRFARIMNALNPGYYQAVDDGIPQMEEANLAAFATRDQLADRSTWKIAYKPRFWHGVKAVLLFWYRDYHLSQLYWMIQIGTFFAFALFAAQVMYLDRQVGLAYGAFAFSSFFCSSVLFFGGVAYSVPLLSTALWGCLWLLFRMSRWRQNRNAELALIVFGGTLLCFFFQLGGCEIFAMALVVFVEIFLPTQDDPRATLRRACESCLFFLAGFFGSILLKHLLIVCLSGSFDVVHELLAKIAQRTGDTNEAGTKIGFLGVFMAQFHWYEVAGYGIAGLTDFVTFSLPLSLALLASVPLWYGVLKRAGRVRESEDLLLGYAGYAMMLSCVAGRYMLLRNHSDIHVFFVSRYLFVYAGTVYFFIFWLLFFGFRLRGEAPASQPNQSTTKIRLTKNLSF